MTAANEVVRAAIAGDENALSTLLEEHGITIRQGLSIAPKWRTVIDPDDVMQVTYLEAFLQIRKLRQPTVAGFIAWLRSIAHNNLRDAIRSLESDKRSGNRAEQAPDADTYTALVQHLSHSSTTPSGAAGRREIQQFVEDALRKLPADYEMVIRLCELESKTGQQAATILGRSHGAVRMLLARAKDCLREILSAESTFFSDTT